MPQTGISIATFGAAMGVLNSQREISRSNGRRHGGTLVSLLLAVLAQSCAASKTELPSLENEKRRLLTKEDQKQAVSTLGKKLEAETAAAKKQIESK